MGSFLMMFSSFCASEYSQELLHQEVSWWNHRHWPHVWPVLSPPASHPHGHIECSLQLWWQKEQAPDSQRQSSPSDSAHSECECHGHLYSPGERKWVGMRVFRKCVSYYFDHCLLHLLLHLLGRRSVESVGLLYFYHNHCYLQEQ